MGWQEYVTLHQHYMVKGEDVVNEWSLCFLGRRNLLDRVRKLPNIKSVRALGSKAIPYCGLSAVF
jgi:hypothetical protein